MDERLTEREKASIHAALSPHTRQGIGRVEALGDVTAAVERIVAARQESLADQVEGWVAGIRCAHVHHQPEGVTKAVSCVNCQSWASSIAMPFFRALPDPSDKEDIRG